MYDLLKGESFSAVSETKNSSSVVVYLMGSLLIGSPCVVWEQRLGAWERQLQAGSQGVNKMTGLDVL